MLGEPDGRAPEDAWFVYSAARWRGGVHWTSFVATMGGANGSLIRIDDWNTVSRLTVRFDERGTVSAVSVDVKNCNIETSGSPSTCNTSGQDIVAADLRQAKRAHDDALRATAGATLVQYDNYQMHAAAAGPGCQWTMRYGVVLGDSFVVAERSLMLRGQDLGLEAIHLEDIKDVKAPEQHVLHWWIPLLKQDGSCFFYSVSKRGDRSRAVQDEVRAKIRAAIVGRPAGD